MNEKKTGWIFCVDNLEGIPYIECPYCKRRIGGKTLIFASESTKKCPKCEKDLSLDNVTDENWDYLYSYYGGDK